MLVYCEKMKRMLDFNFTSSLKYPFLHTYKFFFSNLLLAIIHCTYLLFLSSVSLHALTLFIKYIAFYFPRPMDGLQTHIHTQTACTHATPNKTCWKIVILAHKFLTNTFNACDPLWYRVQCQNNLHVRNAARPTLDVIISIGI